MSDGDGQPTPEETAHHEAAHALAWTKPGLPGRVEWIEVRDGCGFTQIHRNGDLMDRERHTSDAIVQCLVGPQAEATATGSYDRYIAEVAALAGSRGPHADTPHERCVWRQRYDYGKAFGYARWAGLAADNEDWRTWDWSPWEGQARSFVNRYWGEIEELAERILAASPGELGVLHRLDSP